MINWRKVITVVLVACLWVLPLGDLAVSLEAQAAPNPTLIKEQINRLGVGAEVKLKLGDGKKFRGSIEAIEAEGFVLASKPDGSPRRVSYDQVGQLELAKLTYRASGQPNAVEVRRVVDALGVGKHIMVKTFGAKEFRGRIQAIEQDSFSLLPDRQSMPVQIAYNEVSQVGENLSERAKIAIWVGVAVAVTIAIIAAVAIANKPF